MPITSQDYFFRFSLHRDAVNTPTSFIFKALKMKIFITVALFVLSQIGENAGVPAIRPQSQRGIIFPVVDQFDECFVDENQTERGTCKKLSECTTALENWIHNKDRPQTCYFNKFDHIVCCKNEQKKEVAGVHSVLAPIQTFDELMIPTMKPQRRSESACAKFNGPKIAVVHGEPTVPKEFPFMAALGWLSNFDNRTIYRCGGALISNRFVLTAAHCVELGGQAPYVIRLGGVNLTDTSVEDVLIKSIIVHPGYNVTSSYNDIALIELAQDVSDNPVCVWSEHDVAHNNVTAIGYGHTRFAGISSNQLLKASLFLVSNDICENYYMPNTDLLQQGVANTHICAGDPEKLRDTCQGDSGGPIISKVEGDEFTANYVIGITSFGQGCAGGPPSIYTRTSSYINWIEDIVWPMKQFDLRKSKIKEN